MFGGGTIGAGHPHDPYIEAVMEQLGDELGPDCETDYADGQMTAFLDLGGRDFDPDDYDGEPRAALLWAPSHGWLCGAWDGRYLEAVRPLTEAVVPAPTGLVRAAAARVAAGLLPLSTVPESVAPETACASALSPALAAAVAAGHISGDVAARLASYHG